MTEAEWLACTDPHKMLGYLLKSNKLSERKARLFALACCRRIWHLLKEQGDRDAIEHIEQDEFVSGAIFYSPSDMTAFVDAQSNQGQAPTGSYCNWEREQNAETVARAAVVLAARLQAVDASYAAASAEAIEIALTTAAARGDIKGDSVRRTAGETWKAIWEDTSTAVWHARWRVSYLGALRAARRTIMAEQATLLTDIFGDNIRQVQVQRAWLTWNDGTVEKIAQAIYEERAFDRLPILADALEEAGCTNADILNHCREPREHVRGCWVVDLLLGKESGALIRKR